jgi:hypothetical protein
MAFETIRAKEAVQVTFKHQVTRDELIRALDAILNSYGCTGCGLNGMESINLVGDPDPIISNLNFQLTEKIDSVISVSTVGTPQQFNASFQR